MIKKLKDKLNKIEKWEFLGFIFNILIFLIGFGASGIYLVVTGFNGSSYISIIIGILLASIGFGHIFTQYLDRFKLLNYIMYIPAIIIGGLALITIVGFALLPFSPGINLNIDLGILILKDGFVRFALIILDCVLAYKMFRYLKTKIKTKKRI
ncbi:hypothetical protein [Thalassobellus suaedae]|uniref:Uncharacterized protein n=1 Tax=Thalassobellus suaedae TaxID=3074124 RepID=A0ABY9Y700_9FLAO|nr:hypothetical protein RHP49_06290 [Flavobacteriaceae bacterium HL-DH10]